MKVLFLGEVRKTFNDTSSEGDAPVLGEFEAFDIRLSEKWREPDSATLSISASRKWFSNNLIPSSKPGSRAKKYRRARYISFTGPANNQVILVIKSASIDLTMEASDGEFANITVEAADPRVWLSTMPGDLTNPPEKFRGSLQDLMISLSKRCSNADYSGKLPIQRLPISALAAGWSPNTLQSKAGIVATSSIPTRSIAFDLNDPNPPADDVLAALEECGTDFELYPLLVYGNDGTSAPWWRWVMRKRQTLSETLSEELGSIMVQSFNSDLLTNEAIFYDDSSKTYSLGNFNNPTYSGHYGPWLGVTVESATLPPNAQKKKWLQRRAKTATRSMKNVQVNVDVDSSALSIKRMNPGTRVRLNMGGTIFNLAVDELTWSYNYQVGYWSLEDWSL